MQVMIRCRQISICQKKSIDFQRVRMEHHKPPTNGSSNGNSSSSSSSRAYNTEANFDTNMVIILAALLCALICALGLNSIVRCALRCGRRFAFQSAGETAARFAARGIKKSTLRRIPVTAYGSGTCTGIRATECPICLGEFVEGEKLRVLPKCNHGFHVKCIDTWLVSHSSCPTCRHSLLDRPTGSDVDSGPAPATGENSVVVDLDDIG